MSKLLKGKPVAQALLAHATELTAQSRAKPCVAMVRVGDDSAALGYQRSASKVLQQVGIEVQPVELDQQTNLSQLKQTIERLNHAPEITAILILEPLPASLPAAQVQELLDPAKDIDGNTRVNLGRSVSPRPEDLVPLTAAAVLALLDFYQIELRGAKVTLVGDSLTVGRPLANLLLDRSATLTVCDSSTIDLAAATRGADIVITATGQLALLTAEMVAADAIVIDVGTNYDAAGKLRGDVDFAAVSQKVRAITPVPGGIGAVTTALLAERTAQILSRAERD